MLGNFFFSSTGEAGYEIEQSLRFDGSSSYLSRTFGNDGSSRTWTYSGWIKKASLNDRSQPVLAVGNSSGAQNSFFGVPGTWNIQNSKIPGGGVGGSTVWEGLRRDYSAWYHWVLQKRSSTANDFRLYINGVQLATTNNSTTWNNFNRNITHYIGRDNYDPAFLGGYLAELHFVDNQILDHEDFGEFDESGVWRPIEVTGLTYGTNGFYLKFDPSATNGIGHDHSGNGNNFTATGFTTSGSGTDVMDDTPTNNFATLNILEPASASAGTLSNGNLDIASQDYILQKATFRFGGGGPTTGKYYWEVTHTGSIDYTAYIGVTSNLTQDAGEIAGGNDKSWFGNNTSRKYTGSAASYSHTYSSGDVHGYAIDLDAQEFKFYVNGTLKLTDTTLPDPATTVLVPFQFTTNSGSGSWSNTSWNFGQRAFSHQPTGYSSLCTANLPAPDVADGSDYFNTVLWTGNGSSSSRTISGVGFQPDFTWIKGRSYSGSGNRLMDAVRGAGQMIQTNSQNSEFDDSANVPSFASDGFTLTTTGTSYNASSNTYVAWNWLAGNGTSSNTNGSINSTVSVSASSGFSIVTWTGSQADGTVGHGLSVAPGLIIFKRRTNTTSWPVYHSAIGPSNFVQLNEATSSSSSGTSFGSTPTAPTSTVFSVGNNGGTNYGSMVAYCFAEVEGYSRFGSYTGNNNSDGPFVYLGFRAALLIIHSSTSGENWHIKDSTRDTYNPIAATLLPNATNSELNLTNSIDLLSNGFKIRSNSWSGENSSNTFIFAAFAENPFGGSGVSPATAR